jgi:putative membrane protein
MVERIVLCVDRDNDLGEKTGIQGPVIGRDKNIEAAKLLAIADPEDSDANAIFGAVSAYDKLKQAGEDVEVVTITGNTHVGVISDRIIANQIDEVMKKLKPESAIFITDGAEDEYILPLIMSRLKIDSIKRVYVRQNPNIENTYYLIVRALKDVKLRSKIVLPFALLLIVIGVAFLLPILFRLKREGWLGIDYLPSVGIYSILIFFGFYLIFWSYRVLEWLSEGIESFKNDMVTGSLTLTTGILCVVMIFVGIIQGYNSFSTAGSDMWLKVLDFFSVAIWWFFIGIWIFEIGKVLSVVVKKGEFSKTFWVTSASLFAVTITIFGAIGIIKSMLGANVTWDPIVVLSIVLGISVNLLAISMYTYLKRESVSEDRWRH